MLSISIIFLIDLNDYAILNKPRDGEGQRDLFIFFLLTFKSLQTSSTLFQRLGSYYCLVINHENWRSLDGALNEGLKASSDSKQIYFLCLWLFCLFFFLILWNDLFNFIYMGIWFFLFWAPCINACSVIIIIQAVNTLNNFDISIFFFLELTPLFSPLFHLFLLLQYLFHPLESLCFSHFVISLLFLFSGF